MLAQSGHGGAAQSCGERERGDDWRGSSHQRSAHSPFIITERIVDLNLTNFSLLFTLEISHIRTWQKRLCIHSSRGSLFALDRPRPSHTPPLPATPRAPYGARCYMLWYLGVYLLATQGFSVSPTRPKSTLSLKSRVHQLLCRVASH